MMWARKGEEVRRPCEKQGWRAGPSFILLLVQNRKGIPMNPSVLQRGSQALPRSSAQPTVLVATAEPTISTSMRELLDRYSLRTICVRGMEGVRATLAKETVSVCFCGFWLIDGTYRDVVCLLKQQTVEVPAIIVCSPSCPQEYRDYLAALNLRAFDFLYHPYRKADVDRILRAAIPECMRPLKVTEEPTSGKERNPGLRKA